MITRSSRRPSCLLEYMALYLLRCPVSSCAAPWIPLSLHRSPLSIFQIYPAFGRWIDTTNRSKVITATIITQNVCVVVSSICLYLIGASFPVNPELDFLFVLCFAGCLLSSMIGQITGMGKLLSLNRTNNSVYVWVCTLMPRVEMLIITQKGATLALEKDWVVVLCQGDVARLTTTNSRMRRIDLFCKLMAPALFGVITEFLGETPRQKICYGASWVMAWNVIGVGLEYVTLRTVYSSNPVLKTHALKGDQDANKAPATGQSGDKAQALNPESSRRKEGNNCSFVCIVHSINWYVRMAANVPLDVRQSQRSWLMVGVPTGNLICYWPQCPTAWYISRCWTMGALWRPIWGQKESVTRHWVLPKQSEHCLESMERFWHRGSTIDAAYDSNWSGWWPFGCFGFFCVRRVFNLWRRHSLTVTSLRRKRMWTMHTSY